MIGNLIEGTFLIFFGFCKNLNHTHDEKANRIKIGQLKNQRSCNARVLRTEQLHKPLVLMYIVVNKILSTSRNLQKTKITSEQFDT